MNILNGEILPVASFILNLLVSIVFILRAKKSGRTKQALIGAVAGFGLMVGLIFAGMTVAFIAMLLVDYSIETALSLVMAGAAFAIPVGAFIASKVK